MRSPMLEESCASGVVWSRSSGWPTTISSVQMGHGVPMAVGSRLARRWRWAKP